MGNAPIHRPTHRSINKPLTAWGVERRLFWAVLGVLSAAFNLFASLSKGLGIFALLIPAARRATAAVLDLLSILFRFSPLRPRLDPARWEGFALLRASDHDPLETTA